MLRDGGTETQSVTCLFFSVLLSESLFYFLCQHSLSLKYMSSLFLFYSASVNGHLLFFFFFYRSPIYLSVFCGLLGFFFVLA